MLEGETASSLPDVPLNTGIQNSKGLRSGAGRSCDQEQQRVAIPVIALTIGFCEEVDVWIH